MSPVIVPNQPLPSMFDTFEAFMAGTLSWDDGIERVRREPSVYKYAYGVRRVDPATGVMVARCILRLHPIKTDDTGDAGGPIYANGVKRPRAGTVGYSIWLMLDVMTNTGVDQIDKISLEVQATGRGFKMSNVTTEFSMWKKFNNVTWKVRK